MSITLSFHSTLQSNILKPNTRIFR